MLTYLKSRRSKFDGAGWHKLWQGGKRLVRIFQFVRIVEDFLSSIEFFLLTISACEKKPQAVPACDGCQSKGKLVNRTTENGGGACQYELIKQITLVF